MMSSETPPYLNSPTENLTLSNPLCNSDACYAFYEAHQLSQKEVSWYHQFDYGHYISYYLVVILSLFTFSHYLPPAPRRASSTVSLRQRSLALIRWITYQRTAFTPSFGISILLALFILYTLLLTFLVRPYYRQHRGYGSPPLAIRAGLMSVALIPWTVALAGKANFISFLTGIGHERLNVLHRWLAWVCAGLAVVHTIPFLVAPVRDGGWQALRKAYYEPGAYEFTGTPPLGILAGLILLSIPQLRRRGYELFVHSHILLAIIFLGLLFWHCSDEGDSWAYLYATVAIWLSSLVLKTFWFIRPFNILSPSWGSGYPISATVMGDGMISLSILTDLKWEAGQHVYLRIPEVGRLDNHPFTIANACDGGEMKLLIRPREGFTRRLAHAVKHDQREMRAWIEGPYGGHGLDVGGYEHVLLVAGGGGASAVLPVLQCIVGLMRKETGSVKSVRMIWSIRQRVSVGWIAEALREMDIEGMEARLRVDVHVTGGQVSTQSGEEKGSSEVEVGDDVPSFVEHHEGRIVWSEGLFDGLPSGSRAVVIGCGPPGFKVDLSNSCARAQRKVLQGQLAEIHLRTETFDW